jgi:hypothetical protein
MLINVENSIDKQQETLKEKLIDTFNQNIQNTIMLMDIKEMNMKQTMVENTSLNEIKWAIKMYKYIIKKKYMTL